MISTWLAILIAVLTLIIGLVGGFFLARNSMKSYLAKNPPISEEMMKSMMMSMGQKPSQKKLNQMMAQMKQQSANSQKNKPIGLFFLNVLDLHISKLGQSQHLILGKLLALLSIFSNIFLVQSVFTINNNWLTKINCGIITFEKLTELYRALIYSWYDCLSSHSCN